MAGSVSDTRRKMRQQAIVYSVVIGAALIVLIMGGLFIYNRIQNSSSGDKNSAGSTSSKNETVSNQGSNNNLNSNNSNSSNTATDKPAATGEAKQEETEIYDVDEKLAEIVTDLIERNNVVVAGFYFGQSFELSDNMVNWMDFSLPQVKTSLFDNYNEMISYLQKTYTGSPSQQGSVVYNLTMPAKYLSGFSGELLFNVNFVEDGKFYYNGSPRIDWSDYVIKSAEQSGDQIDFVIKAYSTDAYGGDVIEVTGTAVYVNGNWLLNDIIY